MIRFPAPEKLDNKHVRFDVVCYLRLTPSGILDIYYSHHVVHARDGTSGPFVSESKSRMPLDSGLRAVVMLGVLQELWHSFEPNMRMLPGELGVPIEEVEW